MDAILTVFRIAIIATIVVTGIHICFFSTIATIATIAVIRSQLYLFFRIAIIATIVIERDPYIFCLQNCHNCDN